MRLLSVFTSVLIAVFIILSQPLSSEDSYQILAASGCCKEYTQDEWRVISRDYNRCEDLNARYDNRDDIYINQGRFWWDSSC